MLPPCPPPAVSLLGADHRPCCCCIMAEVLEHIRTLEERCRDLEIQVSDTAVERLERLSIELDDAKRLTASFEVS